MVAYYNEWDAYAAQWLRNLIAAGHLPAGEVDERSIAEVQPDDLRGFTQCHFFAGIGGWPLALRLAGWPDNRPVWTGSCPCQPFSAAGKRKGTADARHLWPEFNRLIAKGRPPRIFGEQVASKDGRGWLSGVRADLENLGYAVGAADLCAAGAGAPHIRQRLFWVADSAVAGRCELSRRNGGADGRAAPEPGRLCDTGRLADSAPDGRKQERADGPGGEERSSAQGRPTGLGLRGSPSRMADADGGITRNGGLQPGGKHGQQPQDGRAGFWSDFDLLPCIDGKARRVEPGTFPLAHGIPARVGKLRAYGNAVVPQVAAEFVRAVMECSP